MITQDLKTAEQSVFRAATDTGLWDIFLASVVAMFSIAPLLSGSLGDFWSSAIFLPIWGCVFLGLRLVNDRFVVPRVGVVQFGMYRRKRLRKFHIAMLVINVVALVIGLDAAVIIPHEAQEAWTLPIAFSLIMLVGFSISAFILSIPRLFYYGGLIAAAPLIGEVLFRAGHVSRHGFPIVFGAAALTIAGVGLTKLVVILNRPTVTTDTPVQNHVG